jgi:hypothetical protein
VCLGQPRVDTGSHRACEAAPRARPKNMEGQKSAELLWIGTAFGAGVLSRAFGTRRIGVRVWREAGPPRARTRLARGEAYGLPVRLWEGAESRREPCRRESPDFRGAVETEHKSSSRSLAALELFSTTRVPYSAIGVSWTLYRCRPRRRAWRLPGPRVVAADRAIAMTGRHGWFLGREADGPDAMCRAVRQEMKAGAA